MHDVRLCNIFKAGWRFYLFYKNKSWTGFAAEIHLTINWILSGQAAFASSVIERNQPSTHGHAFGFGESSSCKVRRKGSAHAGVLPDVWERGDRYTSAPALLAGPLNDFDLARASLISQLRDRDTTRPSAARKNDKKSFARQPGWECIPVRWAPLPSLSRIFWSWRTTTTLKMIFWWRSKLFRCISSPRPGAETFTASARRLASAGRKRSWTLASRR